MRYLCFLIGLLCLSACDYEMPETSETTDRFGDETFTRFYVIGDGYGAGMMDGVLTTESQTYAYPALIGGKINSFFEAELFRQPDVNTELGLNRFEPESEGKYRLYYRAPGDEVPSRRTEEGEMPGSFTGEADLLRNFSFPGLRTYDFESAVNSVSNIYLNRLPFNGQQSIADIVSDRSPSVVLVSLGYDDLLPYVMGSATGATELPVNEISDTDATPVAVFESSYRGLIEQLQNDTEASIILTTIPSPLITPAFTTVSYSMELGSEITGIEIGQLNSFYREFNERAFEYNLGDTITDENRRPFIDFDVDGGAQFKARVISDPTLPDVVFDDGYELPKIRQMGEDEYLPFRFEQLFFENPVYGKTEPIQQEDVITRENAASIQELLDGYNSTIRDLAASSADIYLLDIEQLISELYSGDIQVGGVFYNADFSRESLFSGDGLFLNPKGNALVAQRLVEILNREYNVRLLPVDVNSYPGISFEQDF